MYITIFPFLSLPILLSHHLTVFPSYHLTVLLSLFTLSFLGMLCYTYMRMKRMFLIIVVLLTFIFLFPNGVIAATASPCDFAGKDVGTCRGCMESGKSVWTAFGCLPTTSGEFVTTLLQFGSGIAGGIAFLLIIIGGFQIVMSAGNPEKLNEGRELITSAIVGLLFIIFSIFLLKLIGVNILAIPGFS